MESSRIKNNYQSPQSLRFRTKPWSDNIMIDYAMGSEPGYINVFYSMNNTAVVSMENVSENYIKFGPKICFKYGK